MLFVDNDDWLEKHHIEELYRLAKENKADIAAGSFNIFYEDTSTCFSYWINDDTYFKKVYSIKEWFSLQYRTDFPNMSVVFYRSHGTNYIAFIFKKYSLSRRRPVEDDLTTWKVYLLTLIKMAYENNLYS